MSFAHCKLSKALSGHLPATDHFGYIFVRIFKKKKDCTFKEFKQTYLLGNENIYLILLLSLYYFFNVDNIQML